MIRRPEAVDEELGCGWVDGKRKRIDAISYTIRFSPRTPRSTWKEETKARRLRQLIDDSAAGRAIPPLVGKTKT